MPLFPSYLFIRTTEQFRNEVFQVPGVLKYLSIEGKLCTLRDEEIERVARICRFEKEISVSRQAFAAGDEVEVIAGPLTGIKGRLTEKTNGTYLSMTIENLGYTASFRIDRNAVRKTGP